MADEAASTKIRALAAAPNMSPLLAECLLILGQHVAGEWLEGDKDSVDHVVGLSRKLVQYDSEFQSMRVRVEAAERREADARATLSTLLEKPEARVQEELLTARAQIDELSRQLNETGLRAAFESSYVTATDEAASLRATVKSLQAQLTAARDELHRYKHSGTKATTLLLDPVTGEARELPNTEGGRGGDGDAEGDAETEATLRSLRQRRPRPDDADAPYGDADADAGYTAEDEEIAAAAAAAAAAKHAASAASASTSAASVSGGSSSGSSSGSGGAASKLQLKPQKEQD